MKKTSISIFLIFIFSISNSCSTFEKTKSGISKSDETKIPFEKAKNYFSKKSDNSDTITTKINSQEEFDSYFGSASTMGKDGIPTPIDFSKQTVIAIISPTVKRVTEFEAKKLIKTKESIVLTYSLVEGPDIDYSIQPNLILVTDKINEEVTFIRK